MYTEKLKMMTEEYISMTETLLASRKIGEGVFGTHDSAKESPCHMGYYDAVGEAVQEILKEHPETDAYDEVVRFLLLASSSYECSPLAQWTLVAIQNHALPLISGISREAKTDLYDIYRKNIPVLQRMPNQVKIIKALKK